MPLDYDVICTFSIWTSKTMWSSWIFMHVPSFFLQRKTLRGIHKDHFFPHTWTSFPFPGAAMSQRPSLRLPDGLVIRGKKHMRCKGVETALRVSPPFRFKMVTYWDNKCDKSGSILTPKALNGFRHAPDSQVVQVAVWVFANGMCQVFFSTGSGMCQFPA